MLLVTLVTGEHVGVQLNSLYKFYINKIAYTLLFYFLSDIINYVKMFGVVKND